MATRFCMAGIAAKTWNRRVSREYLHTLILALVPCFGPTEIYPFERFRNNEDHVIKNSTVEPLTNDHPHQRPSLSYDHISCDGLWFLFVYESLTSDHPSYTTTPMCFWGWSYKRGSTVLSVRFNKCRQLWTTHYPNGWLPSPTAM